MLDEYYVIETNFRKQTFPEFYATLHGFADALDANEHFNTNRPDWIPGGDKFREHVATMKELGVGADRGDSLLKDRRQAVRELCEIDMDACVSYMRTVAIYKRDPTVLHTMSLPFKNNGQKNTHKAAPQAVEIHVQVKHLKGVTGAIVIEATHMRNGGPYLINLCKGDPTSEGSWYNPGGHYKSCSRIILKTLEPANRYYVRMRTDGPDGPGPWSQPVSIIVL